jgi:Kef-type K+ transport system membrane component KefB
VKERVIIILAVSAGLIGGELIKTGGISASEVLGFVFLVSAIFFVGLYLFRELLKRLASRRRR